MHNYPLSLYHKRFAYLPMWMSNGEIVWLNVYYKRIKYCRGHMHVFRNITEEKFLKLIARGGTQDETASNNL